MNIHALLSPDDGDSARPATSSSTPAAPPPPTHFGLPQQQRQQQQPPQQQYHHPIYHQSYRPQQYQDQARPAPPPPQRKPAAGRGVRNNAPPVKRSPSRLSREIPQSADSATSSPAPRQPPPTTYGTPPRQAFHANPATSVSPEFGAPPHQAPTSNPGPSPGSASHQRPGATHRPFSTPEMGSRSDMSSAQKRKNTQRTHSANSIKPSERAYKRQSPLKSPLGKVSPTTSAQISFAAASMADAPAPTPPPREFSSTAFSDKESKTVNELLSILRENSYAHAYHVELVNLLHKGFLAHVYGSSDDRPSAAAADPRRYALLAELRQAREAMDSRFAVGENIWLDWLSDEILIASTTEERITVTELCQKAVQDEPASVKLWRVYADWMTTNFATCHDLEGSDQTGWTSESKTECSELFTKDSVRDVFAQGIAATQWRIDESQTLWRSYMQLVLDEFPASPTPKDIEGLTNFFIRRLQIPHADFSDTEQSFWSAISKIPGMDWEVAMEHAKELSEPAKREVSMREGDEFALQKALQSGDLESVHAAYESFIHAEKFRKHRGPFYYDLRCAAFERALLHEPTATAWWLDYVDFVMTSSNTRTDSLLPLIERATRHCPGSGELWARRIVRADVERKSRGEVESIKHRATNSGLLDLGGMEGLVTMLQQWCSYLRRHAFSRINLEDDRDTAEFGIMSALEDIQQAGKKIYGRDFEGDPLFRLDQVQIKFYTESRRTDEARQIYEALAKRPLYARSYDFWNKYYNWELWLWGYTVMTDKHRVETTENGPHRATAVVTQALAQKVLDFPQNVLELYLYHFQQHESGENLQVALVDSREFTVRLNRMNEKAAKEAAQQQAQYAVAAPMLDQATSEAGGKRKREDDVLINGNDHKRSKTDDDDAAPSHAEQSGRDREHNTITIKNLPPGTTDDDIKAFFQDYGAIRAITMLDGDADATASATVEFENQEDAESSVIRSGKELKGQEIQIQSGGRNILYVCNYPAEYDEEAIRGLFKHYGAITGVRFPSLKLNIRRRFCYVSFATAAMAKAAEVAMDGKKLDGLHTLTAKISDPNAKKERGGAQKEGREIFVKNLDWNVPEDDVRTFFSQYGKLESMHLLKQVNNKLTGNGFVVYSSADEAHTAIEGAHQKPFRERILTVELSTPKGRAAPQERMRKEDIIVKQGGATPEPRDHSESAARRGSDVSMTSVGAPGATGDDSYKTVRERKIAIFHLPDTVNDARIRAAMERYGPITKISMRREIEGAIVEFAKVQDAFNVRQGVDLGGLGTGVSTGDVGELLAKKKGGKKATGALAMVPTSVSHRTVGRRGGLGFKRGGGHGGTPGRSHQDGASGEAGAKSNADFRRMFTQGNTGAAEGNAAGVTQSAAEQ